MRNLVIEATLGLSSPWRTKGKYTCVVMPVRSCRVTITDMEGIARTVEVPASTLYEAVALGLTAMRGNSWVMGIPDGFNPVKVRVMDVPVDHEVRLKDFTQWLDRRTAEATAQKK